MYVQGLQGLVLYFFARFLRAQKKIRKIFSLITVNLHGNYFPKQARKQKKRLSKKRCIIEIFSKATNCLNTGFRAEQDEYYMKDPLKLSTTTFLDNWFLIILNCETVIYYFRSVFRENCSKPG